MNRLFDLPLARPLPDGWLHGLLFFSFTLHMLFVLITLGTAVLSVYFFVRFHWGGGLRQELELDRRILRTFLAHKSLAVVLGVAPLLLMQVTFAISFFTAVNLLAPWWMCIIALLIVAFLAFDILGHGIETHRRYHLLVAAVALSCLVAVPGILAAVLVVLENPDKWQAMALGGFHISGQPAVHWLFRFLHVLGAGLVIGAAYHYFFTARTELGKSALLRWMTAGLLLQIVLGAILYASLTERPDPAALVAMVIGAVGAGLLLVMVLAAAFRASSVNLRVTVPLLMLVLVSMLLTRQMIQFRKIVPLQRAVEANAVQYEEALLPYAPEALDAYRASLAFSYNDAETIYLRSCAFCHGKNARGNGLEAKNLIIPAENLMAVRTTRPYLYSIITGGVAGTGMGYFTVYDRYQMDDLMAYLNEKYGVLGEPANVPAPVSPQAAAEANRVYAGTCSPCHAVDGGGSPVSKGFRPPPPDLRVYGLMPGHAFDVITNGYPGTMMAAFKDLPEDVRWGLVQTVGSKRRAGK
jgi:mono/diheme cytochrome c family protein